MLIHRLVSLVSLALVLPACGGSEPHAAGPSSPPRWSYEGETGPAHWGDLDPSFALCAHGTKQTPIDLPPRPARSATPASVPHWEPIPLLVKNTGHTVQVDDTAPSSLVVDGTTYALTQFHFHSPAEHTIDGRAYDAEMHLVHKSADGKVLVVAILFARGRDNAALVPLWNAMPVVARPEAASVPGVTIDVASLLPKRPKFYRYEGSLTVPPCTEGVTWLVVEPDPDAPAQMSDAQIGRLRAATHGGNNRPLQPGRDRVIEEMAP